MASMNGIEVRAVKTFTGHDGPNEQAYFYIDGKRAGFYSEDANGAVFGHWEWVSPEMEEKFKEKVEEYCKKNPIYVPKDKNAHSNEIKTMEELVIENIKDGYEHEMFMDDLFSLCFLEKEWKKGIKKGFNHFNHLCEIYNINSRDFTQYPVITVRAGAGKIREYLDEKIEKMRIEKDCQLLNYRLYSSLEDFKR